MAPALRCGNEARTAEQQKGKFKMTTTVVVNANHGWPVTVMQVDPKTSETIGMPQTVSPGEQREFCVHSGADLHVHEVQPEENNSGE